MRSIRWLAAVTGTLALGTACGGNDGGGGVGPNNPPVANFTAPTCTVNVVCSFTDASTDDNNNITTWAWNFGDNGTANVQNPTHTYAATGTYNVSLTVTDGGGESNTKVNAVVVNDAPPPPNQAPVAGFTFVVTGNSVAFSNTSTDADGTIATNAWTFGDNATSAEASPTHAYAAVTQPTDFTVTLTVTDDDGAQNTATQTVTIQPPAAQNCITAGTNVDCILDLTIRSTVTIKLTGVSCELGASRVTIPAPIGPKQVFGNVCFKPVNSEYTILDDAGAPRVFEAGTQLPVRFTQGTPDPGDPAVGAPAGEIEGTSPSWTISIEDGGNPTGPGEPDFNDVVLTVTATAAP